MSFSLKKMSLFFFFPSVTIHFYLLKIKSFFFAGCLYLQKYKTELPMEQVTEKKERAYTCHLITPTPLPVRCTGSLCGFASHWERPESESLSVVSDSWRPHGLHSPWNSPDQNTGVGSLSLLQGSSQPREGTQVSRIAGGLFTS